MIIAQSGPLTLTLPTPSPDFVGLVPYNGGYGWYAGSALALDVDGGLIVYHSSITQGDGAPQQNESRRIIRATIFSSKTFRRRSFRPSMICPPSSIVGVVFGKVVWNSFGID